MVKRNFNPACMMISSPGWRLDRTVSIVAQRYPQRTAIELQGFSISYSQLEQLSNCLATKLINNGVGEGVFVAVAARNVAEFAVGSLAVLKAGAAYIALDLRYSHSRITQVLELGSVDLCFLPLLEALLLSSKAARVAFSYSK